MPNLAETFHSLHRQKDILILPNAWDAGSAKVVEDAGAKAIATSSAGVAWALGYPDGDVLPPRMLADLTANITAAIRIPLSVDFEGAYTKNPSKVGENLKPILEAGVSATRKRSWKYPMLRPWGVVFSLGKRGI